MKKIALIILVFITGVFLGTKLLNTKQNGTNTKSSCNSKLLEIITNSTEIDNVELSKILQSCGSIICEPENVNLLKQVESFHTIDGSNYKNMIYKFWESNIDLSDKKYYNEVEWAVLDEKIKNICYEEYLSFYYSANKTNDVSITTTKNFTEKPSCYSMPLFKSIYENHKSQIKPNTKVKFYKALNQNNDIIIVFEIEGITVGSYYDISNVPMILKPGFLNFLKKIATLQK